MEGENPRAEDVEFATGKHDRQTLREVWLPLYCAALQGVVAGGGDSLEDYAADAAAIADWALQEYVKREQ